MKQVYQWLAYLALITTGLVSAPSHAAQFKIATLSPDGSTWMKKMREGAEEIETKTNQRVTFKFYPGGVMGQDKAVLRKMRVGQLHGGAFVNGTLAATYPGVQVYNLVMKFKSYEEVDYVRPKMDHTIVQGLEDNGLVALGLSEIGFAYLMSMNPVHSIAELRKQKAWIPENNIVATEALKAFSVDPIPLPLRDVLVALQTGMVDTVAGSPIGALTLQWHTKIKYLINLPLAYIYGVLALNKKDFEKISAEDQQIVREVMGRISEDMNDLNRKDNEEAIEAMRNLGITIIEPQPEAVDELVRLVAVANKNLIETGGVPPDLVQTLDKHLQEFRSQKAQAHE